MSLERLKKHSQRFALFAKILYIITIVVIILQTISFMWQALMPNKLSNFFNAFRIYEPFISNINDNALCLYELSGMIFNNIFLFLILFTTNKLFVRFASSLLLEDVISEMKKVALIFIGESICVPLMKTICYTIFVKLPLPTGIFDFCPLVIGGLLYFIAIIIDSKSVIQDK